MHTIYTRGYIFNCLFSSLKHFSIFFVSKQIMYTSTRVCSCVAGDVVEMVTGGVTRGGADVGDDCSGIEWF